MGRNIFITSSMMSSKYGIRVVRPGYDANDPNLDRRNVTFDSTMEHLQFQDKYYQTHTWDTTGLKTIPHGLGFAPMFLAYLKKNGSNKWVTAFTNTGKNDVYVDKDNLYVFGEVGDIMTTILISKPMDPAEVGKGDLIRTGGYGIVSVVPGADANSPYEADINVHTGLNSLIIYDTIEIDILNPTTTTRVSKPHGLPYVPGWLGAYYLRGDFVVEELVTEPFHAADFTDYTSIYVEMDETNVTAVVDSSADLSDLEYNFKIRIFTFELGK